MMTECDNTSVGVIVENEGDILLIERARFPWGWAAPAGHIDEHGGPDEAAITEVREETGLMIPIEGLERVIEARRVENQCRRVGGDHHVWTVFKAESATRDTTPSPDETSGMLWATPVQLTQMIERTQQTSHERVRQGDPVLERIWMEYFVELGIPHK